MVLRSVEVVPRVREVLNVRVLHRRRANESVETVK